VCQDIASGHQPAWPQRRTAALTPRLPRGRAAVAAVQPAPLQLPARVEPGANGAPADARAHMAAASGWSPEFARQRMLAEAFGSVFVT